LFVFNKKQQMLRALSMTGTLFRHHASQAVLPHKRRDMKIVQSVAGRVRVLTREIAHRFRVALCFHQDLEEGDARRPSMKLQASAKVGGCAKTERCVATRRNS